MKSIKEKMKEIKQKVRTDEVYAQNLYAALCNMQWVKDDSVKAWHCSWRYAGSVVATMNGEGDYLDWYFSSSLFSKEGFVNEGAVTDCIINDLKEIGFKNINYAQCPVLLLSLTYNIEDLVKLFRLYFVEMNMRLVDLNDWLAIYTIKMVNFKVK